MRGRLRRGGPFEASAGNVDCAAANGTRCLAECCGAGVNLKGCYEPKPSGPSERICSHFW